MGESLWIVPFGKHKGDAIENLTTGYLEWLTEQDWFLEKFKDGAEAVGKELAYRTRFGAPEPDEDRDWNRRNRR